MWKFQKPEGSLVLGCHLRASGVRVGDSAGTCSNLSYFLIKAKCDTKSQAFVPRQQVKTGNCILAVVLEM